MSKPHVYRPGDRVRVVNPRWIRRVGYPIVWTEIEQEVRDMRRTQEAWATFIGMPLTFTCTLTVSDEFARACAMHVVEERGFGGNTRSIYYEDPIDDQQLGLRDAYYGFARNRGQVLEVYSKRIVHTGIRVPAWGDGDDYVDGYLDERKTHVLLRTAAGEIEACDVEPAA